MVVCVCEKRDCNKENEGVQRFCVDLHLSMKRMYGGEKVTL